MENETMMNHHEKYLVRDGDNGGYCNTLREAKSLALSFAKDRRKTSQRPAWCPARAWQRVYHTGYNTPVGGYEFDSGTHGQGAVVVFINNKFRQGA